MREHKGIFLYLVVVATATFHGCASFSNLQDPRVLEPGDVAARSGLTFIDDTTPRNDVAVRVGIIRNLETEFKTDLQSNTLSLRYQLTTSPLSAVGISRLGIYTKTFTVDGPEKQHLAWLVNYLVGGDHWFLGAKATYSTFDGQMADFTPVIIFEKHRWNFLTIIGGAKCSISGIDLLFEINNVMSRRAKPLLIPAIAVSKIF